MPIFSIIYHTRYIDSLETLFQTTFLSSQSGINSSFVGMCTSGGKHTIDELSLTCESSESALESDLIIVANADSEEIFRSAVKTLEEQTKNKTNKTSFSSVKTAVGANPAANLCVISVPGEYVKREAFNALDLGLHIVIFSNHVPFEEERQIKEYARDKGLLCMGPDCGVANINGAAFVLGSITQSGPVGICGASGVGIQYIGAMLDKAGSGVSQIIGTGGNDTKDEVGGITTLMGIDALENDPKTQYIVLVSRKPGKNTFEKIKARIAKCKKPVVAYYMGATSEEITETGAIWAANLEDASAKAIRLAGKALEFDDVQKLNEIAAQAIQKMNPEQKYVRGAFLGGTYCDEALRTLNDKIGGVYSNIPVSPEWTLKDSGVSVKNTVIDYGEEEFTKGRPHPVIDPSVRLPAILREASDPETAVLLLDFVLTPPGPKDSAGPVIEEIKKARELVRSRGGELAVVASVCGTNLDIQKLDKQEAALKEAGVYVCMSNYKAALLAGEIIRNKMEVTNGGR
jgi:succinyl-CoA synthetase alpha subunit